MDRLKQGLWNRQSQQFHRLCFSLLHNMLHIDALDLAEVVEDQVQKELGVVGQIAVLQADQGQPLGERLVLVPEGEDVDVRRDFPRRVARLIWGQKQAASRWKQMVVAICV